MSRLPSKVLSRDGKQPFFEAAALLSHVTRLESTLPEDENQFGHPTPPQLHMCRIPDPEREGKDLGIVALMAVTKRCISAQLLEESISFVPLGTPVEVLVLSGEDQITCATIVALELPELTATNTLVVAERDKSNRDVENAQRGTLLNGGLVPIMPSPKVAILAGTSHSRVMSIELSVNKTAMQLVRRNLLSGNEVRTYFEPLPWNTLTKRQARQRKKPSTKQSPRVSTESDKDDLSREPVALLPFQPSGGVVSIKPYTIIRDGESVTHVWISFGDGTGLRVHHAGFFASVIQKHTESQPNEKSLEEILGDTIVRWQAKLPPLEDTRAVLIPMPKYHPSPLAPFPIWKKPEINGLQEDPAVCNGNLEGLQEFYEAILYCTGAMADSFPTLAFYTSEDQFEGRIQGDSAVEAKEPEFGGGLSSMLGGFLGIFSAGSSGVPKEEPVGELEEIPSMELDQLEAWDPAIPFPSINFAPLNLFAGSEIHDPPRQVTHCTVDPEGDLAAIADTLGRVSLVDLATKQIVRMWKGFRDTSCYWIQTPQPTEQQPWQKSKVLYLVIHSRQRKILEIWRARHGPRVKQIQVNRDAQVINCREITPFGLVASCYLAHSNVPFSSMNQIERIAVSEDKSVGNVNAVRNRPSKRVEVSLLPQDAVVRLNHMQQLLGETNVECQSIDVFKALEGIKSLEDLAAALDLIALAPTLEGKMGVEGSSFQKLAVSHCKEKLDDAIQDVGEERAFSNPHVQFLAFKITCYNQIMKGYDILRRYETGGDAGNGTADIGAPTTWAREAVGWTSAYEKITKKSIDADILQSPRNPMKFHEFASACVAPKNWMEAPYDVNGGYKLYLSDSSKTRLEILVRIFKPLLGDIFSFNIVNHIFESLGIKDDFEYVLKCFGEWFTSLSVKDVTKKAIFVTESPTRRWLQEIVTRQFEIGAETQMESLFQFCRASEELIRAFWLATLCREAIYQASIEQEEKTYGKVSCEKIVSRWDQLLRQLRVCLLVSLRLNGMKLGICPISIKAVEKGDNFSVFEWLVKDELSMSHKNEEIVSLENACRLSGRAFDPSTTAGDKPARFKLLQNSCLSAALSEAERAEYLVDFDDDDRLGALLLYMRPHNIGEILVAHRALQLASKWGRKPEQLQVLEDTIVALKNIDVVDYKRIASAVRLEVWQSHIRPFYRALLIGFHDVQEISPEVVRPLLQNDSWIKSFSELSSTILDMLSEIKFHESEIINNFEPRVDRNDITWPPVVDCFVLERLVERNRLISESSLKAHRILLRCLRVSKDIPTLSTCVPSFYHLFSPGALFHDAVFSEEIEEQQLYFLQDAIVAYARDYTGPSIESLDLGDIGVLADLWNFDMDNVNTLFLLSMYEYGKDRAVDDLITKCASSISVVHFCEDGMEIICRRLHHLLHVEASGEIKNIMGSLDADMCEWIREKALNSEPLVNNGKLQVPVGDTHMFGLRLLSLAASAKIAKENRVKIHSLIVLSGIIVKTLQEA